jgi:hypothetical protein
MEGAEEQHPERRVTTFEGIQVSSQAISNSPVRSLPDVTMPDSHHSLVLSDDMGSPLAPPATASRRVAFTAGAGDDTHSGDSSAARGGGSYMSSEVLDRAVTTASSMADWAGRAVRNALKEHARSNGQPRATSSVAAAIAVDRSIASPTVVAKGVAMAAVAVDLVEPRADNVDVTTTLAATIEVKPPQSPMGNDSAYSSNAAQSHDDFSMLMSAEDSFAETRDARRKFNAAMRDTETLTDDMRAEVIDLLQALNLPYLVAPFEAEAQCAVLEQVLMILFPHSISFFFKYSEPSHLFYGVL